MDPNSKHEIASSTTTGRIHLPRYSLPCRYKLQLHTRTSYHSICYFLPYQSFSYHLLALVIHQSKQKVWKFDHTSFERIRQSSIDVVVSIYFYNSIYRYIHVVFTVTTTHIPWIWLDYLHHNHRDQQVCLYYYLYSRVWIIHSIIPATPSQSYHYHHHYDIPCHWNRPLPMRLPPPHPPPPQHRRWNHPFPCRNYWRSITTFTTITKIVRMMRNPNCPRHKNCTTPSYKRRTGTFCYVSFCFVDSTYGGICLVVLSFWDATLCRFKIERKNERCYNACR